MPLREPLGVWLHGVRVAELIARGPGAVQCRYTPAARELWPEGTPLLSCSLPLGARLADAAPYLAGLLPDPEHRARVAAVHGVPPGDAFSLVERLGRDLPGAAVVAHGEPGARAGGAGPSAAPTAEPYDATSLADDVAHLADRPLGVRPDSASSIGGRGDKLLLVQLPGGRWGRPAGGHPSTHVLKLEDPRFPGRAAAEAACLAMARELDLTWLEVEHVSVGGRSGLFMPRFDRTLAAGGDAGIGGPEVGAVGRLHAEDACQALGRDPEAARGRGLYEETGGPGLRAVAALLAAHAEDPERELAKLVTAVTFTVVIGNADAHGRNLGLLHPRPGVLALAPLYGTVPTTLWSTARADAAMAVAGRSSLRAVTLDDLETEGAAWGLGRRKVRREAWRAAERLRDLAGKADPRLGGLVATRAEALLAT
jgi:serine/threonine-protein kinase HipA